MHYQLEIKIRTAGFKLKMLIAESYLLVFLEKWKHRKSIAFGHEGTLCLAGAGIMNLYLRGKLILEGKRLKIIDTTPTGVEFLDEILTMIKDSKKIRKLNRWIILISNYRNIKCDSLVFKSLENQGILQFERRILYKWRYNFIRPEVIQSLLQRIQNAFIDNLDPDIELLCLLSLLKITRLFKVCISKEYRNQVKYRMEQLLRFGNYDPSHLEMIVKTKKAIRNALREGIIA